MNHDIDVKKVRTNCFRQSKVPGEFMLQMRVPGAVIEAKHVNAGAMAPFIWGPDKPWIFQVSNMKIFLK